MERTPPNTYQYGSDSNIYAAKERSGINIRQNKKKRIMRDSDSESSQDTRRHKSSSLSLIHETLNAFREEIKSMHNLMSAMKEDQDTNYTRIQADISEIKSEVIGIKIKNLENEKIMENIENNYSQICKKQEDFLDISKRHENNIKDLMQKNVFLEKYNQSLEERIGQLEQKEFDLDIEIINVEQKEDENVKELVRKIASIMNMNTEEIVKVWRISGKNINNKPKPIIVSLCSKEVRSMWLKLRKINISNHVLYNNNNSSRIYINERTTRQTRQLFWSAKMQLKAVFQFIWIQNGKKESGECAVRSRYQ